MSNHDTEATLRLARNLAAQADRSRDAGDQPAARERYEQAQLCYESLPEPPAPELAHCLNERGKILSNEGEYPRARLLLERALGLRRRTLGEEHPETAESLQALGEMEFDCGDFDAGQRRLETALVVRERTLGPEAPATLENLAVLALMRAYRQERDRALEMLQSALTVCERTLGENHPTTARVLNGLGVVWNTRQETLPQARHAYERALAINERLKGLHHPDTLRSLANLGAAHAGLDELAPAQSLLEHALALHRQHFGRRDPRTAFALLNLADLYKIQRRDSEARPLYEEALIIREQTWGPRHPETLRALRRLVEILGRLQQSTRDPQLMTEAMPLFQCLMALEAAAGILDPANRQMPGAHLDPERAAARLHTWIARLEDRLQPAPLSPEDQGAREQARELAHRAGEAQAAGEYESAHADLTAALALQERILGPNDLDHLPLLEALVKIEEQRGRPAAVLPLLQRIVDLHLRLLGPAHPETLFAQSRLIARYSDEYGFTAIFPLQKQLLQAMEEALGPEDPNVRIMRRTLEQSQQWVIPTPSADLSGPSRSEKREAARHTPLSPEKAALLEGLDAVDWHTLNHAYGPADDVPGLLRELLSDDATVREAAWEELGGTVCHQGTIYPATAAVVPFILRMLDWGTAGGAGEIDLLWFLIALAEGQGYHSAHEGDEEARRTWQEILSHQGKDLETEIQKEKAAFAALHRALIAGLPLYLRRLDSSDPEIRRMGLFILSALPGAAETTVPLLRDRLAAETDPPMRTALLRALDNLMDYGPESRQFFARWMDARPARTAFFAAVALLKRAGPAAPDAAADLLIRAFHSPPTREEAGDYWFESPTTDAEAALHALVALGPDRAVPALLRILPALTDPDPALKLAELLLDLTFNAGRLQRKSTAVGRDPEGVHTVEYWEPKPQPRRDPATLTAVQRTVLRALRDHAPFWAQHHNLLAIYGLPETRTDLHAWT